MTKLGELGEVNRGRSRHRPRDASHLYGGPYPFIQTGDIKNSGGRITSFTQTYSEDGLAQSRLWPAQTMCITIAANIAETALLSFPACFPDSVVGFIADENKCDVRFIEYVFRRLRQRIQSEATGSVQDNINLQTLARLSFAIPPLREQIAIADVLGAFDDRIAHLSQTSTTLEAIAQALFKSWFVDFDPVHAKAEGRDPEAMDAATALFPSEFEDSELGPIPKGWDVETLGGAANVIDCLHAKKPELLDNGRPYLQLNCIRSDGLLDVSVAAAISDEDYEKWTSRIEAKTGDCVITNVGRVGAVAQIPRNYSAAIGRNMTAVRCKSTFPYPTTLIELLTSGFMRHEIEQKTDAGTILAALNVKNIPKLRFVRGADEILENFETLCRPLRTAMEGNLQRANLLASLRDTLLPRLISGKLRLPEARELAEAHA